MTKRLTKAQSASVIHSALAMAGEDGLELAEILEQTGLSRAQFKTGWPFLQDTLIARGTPINVTHRAPYRYSIPKPVNGDATIDHNLWRQAIIAKTTLRRLMVHAVAGKDYHPKDADDLDRIAGTANRCIKAIDKVLANFDDAQQTLEVES